MDDKLIRIVERATTDARFRAALERDGARALDEYALTADERAALLDPNGAWRSAAVDFRLTKTDVGGQDAIIEWFQGLLP